MATVQEIQTSVAAQQSATEAIITEQRPFLWGTMYSLDAKLTSGTSKKVFAWNSEDEPSVINYFSTADEIVNFVSLQRDNILGRAPWIERFTAKIGFVDIVAAVIALVFAFTIIGLVIAGKPNIPEIMGNAVTLILGFYFGKRDSPTR